MLFPVNALAAGLFDELKEAFGLKPSEKNVHEARGCLFVLAIFVPLFLLEYLPGIGYFLWLGWATAMVVGVVSKHLSKLIASQSEAWKQWRLERRERNRHRLAPRPGGPPEPPPPTPAQRAADAKRRRDVRLATIEQLGLNGIALAGARAKAEQDYLWELDAIWQGDPQ